MSILINGMEMPECCGYCPFEYKNYCMAKPSLRVESADRHPDCPLISVPPHGRPVSEIEKIIESLQEQADIYNARAQELLVEEDGQVSQYTWAVSLRETYRRIIKTLDDLIS